MKKKQDRLSLAPLSYEQAVDAFLKVKPKPKPPRKKKARAKK